MTTRRPSHIVVRQDEQRSIPVEVLAHEITAISAGVRQLREGRLNDDGLFLLIQHAAPKIGGRGGRQAIPLKTIKAVFDGIDRLERTFVRPPRPTSGSQS